MEKHADTKTQTTIDRSPSERVLSLSRRRVFAGRADREMLRVLTFAAFAPVLMAIPSVTNAQSMTLEPASSRIVPAQEDPRRMADWERVSDFRINDNGEVSSAQPSEGGTPAMAPQGGQAPQSPKGSPQGTYGVNQSGAPTQAPPLTKVVTPAEPQAPQNQPISYVIPEAKAAVVSSRQPTWRQPQKQALSTKLPTELPGTSIVGSFTAPSAQR